MLPVIDWSLKIEEKDVYVYTYERVWCMSPCLELMLLSFYSDHYSLLTHCRLSSKIFQWTTDDVNLSSVHHCTKVFTKEKDRHLSKSSSDKETTLKFYFLFKIEDWRVNWLMMKRMKRKPQISEYECKCRRKIPIRFQIWCICLLKVIIRLRFVNLFDWKIFLRYHCQ